MTVLLPLYIVFSMRHDLDLLKQVLMDCGIRQPRQSFNFSHEIWAVFCFSKLQPLHHIFTEIRLQG